MAIEDHPQFNEWASALAGLNKAWDEYSTAKAFKQADIAVKEAAVFEAIRHFNEISDKIDA